MEDHGHLGCSRGQRKTVLSLWPLADVSLVSRSLQIFDKEALLPLAPQERHLLVRGCSGKTQATSCISVMISPSMCKKLLCCYARGSKQA